MFVLKNGTELHDGHWYTTSTPVRGAHCTPDGRAVGIFCAPDQPLVAVPDGKGGHVMKRGPKRPARIVIQAPDGNDLFEWDTTNPHQPVQQFAVFPVDQLADVQPLEEADHLPEARRAHLDPGTKLHVPARDEWPTAELPSPDRFRAEAPAAAKA